MVRLVCLLALLVAPVAHAVPLQLAHQGRVSSNGARLDGDHDLTVKLYTRSTQGSVVWQETATVAFSEGYYSVILGSDVLNNPLDPDAFDVSELWVAISVDGGAELLDRVPLLSVPYALVADHAASVKGGVVDATEIKVDGTTVIDTDGNWVGAGLDTLAGLDCAFGQSVVYSGTAWVCYTPTTGGGGGTVRWTDILGVPVDLLDGDDDAIGALATCDTGQVPKWDNGTGRWTCGTDAVRTDADIRAAVAGTSIDLASGSRVGGAPIVTSPVPWASITVPADVSDGDDDTLADLASECDDGQLPAWDDVASTWACADDVDTVLTGAQVRAHVAGQAIAPSDVTLSGALVLGTPTVCTTPGTLRWSGSALEVCTGAAWTAVVVPDRQPNPVSFVTVTPVPGARAVSNTVTLTGFEGTLVATAAGDGDPLLRVGGGAWVAAAQVQSGDSVELSLTASSLIATRTASLVVGDTSAAWTVTSKFDNATCKTLRDAGTTTNGTYTIDPDGPGGNAPISVYCDMGGGGWAYAAQGVPFRIPYTGGPVAMQSPIVSTTYEFTLFGAAGGPNGNGSDNQIRPRANGGMAKGQVLFLPRTQLWVYAGGMGTGGAPADSATHATLGGFNGGGAGSRGGSGGGGATDVRVGDALLTSRILVAGGGGGCGYDSCAYAGGQGGGATGQNGQQTPHIKYGTGGTQSAGGAPFSYYTGDAATQAMARGGFGFGGNAIQQNDEGGGGGGWYGGGSGGYDNAPGGGGSSYIGGVTGGTTTQGQNPYHGFADYIFQ